MSAGTTGTTGTDSADVDANRDDAGTPPNAIAPEADTTDEATSGDAKHHAAVAALVGTKKSGKHGLLLAIFTLLFVIELVAVALFEKKLGLHTIGISDGHRVHPQWLAGLGAIVALVSVPLAFLTLRFYQVRCCQLVVCLPSGESPHQAPHPGRSFFFCFFSSSCSAFLRPLLLFSVR